MIRYLISLIAVLVITSLLTFLVTQVSACYFPEDSVAIEVVLNKPGITYDLTILNKLGNVKVLSNDVIAYRSHLSKYVAVLLIKEPITPSGIKYLGVRVQPMFKVFKNGTTKSLVSKELTKEVLKYELNWLIRLGVIKGLSKGDVKEIISEAKVGLAGWNSRIVYANGEWLPYYKAIKYIPGAAMVRACLLGIPEVNQLFKLLPERPPKTTSPLRGSKGGFSVNDAIPIAVAVIASVITYVVIRKVIK